MRLDASGCVASCTETYTGVLANPGVNGQCQCNSDLGFVPNQLRSDCICNAKDGNYLSLDRTRCVEANGNQCIGINNTHVGT